MNKSMILVLLILVFLICGCEPGERTGGVDCLNEHATSEGYNYSGQTPEEAESDCLDNSGEYCAASNLIPAEAAICLAEEMDFAAGVEPWGVSLWYWDSHKTITWGVKNTLEKKEFEASGETMRFHATTGEHLGTGSWDMEGDPILSDPTP
jgi:hypothetical protein